MKELYGLWLATKFKGVGAKMTELITHFGDAEGVYRSESFDEIQFLNSRDKRVLMEKDLSETERIFWEIDRIGGKIILYGDENYPTLLTELHNPPSVLYIKGKYPSLDDVLTIGVVGTRSASEYGRLATERICGDLARAGAVTISGMAAGIDAVGAWTTIREGGMAVGVIGSGIDIVYPSENAELYKAVADEGCIISEFPPGTPPAAWNFPVRNRIIAGLSRGVLVTEAPLKSGSLITARFAMEEGRDVFAVPRNINDIKFGGTNKIIQQGAKLVTSAEDILCEYPYTKSVKLRDAAKVPKTLDSVDKVSEPSEKFQGLNDGEREIASLLVKRDMQIDEIAEGLNISAGETNTRLIMLEMKGVIERLPAGNYRIKL